MRNLAKSRSLWMNSEDSDQRSLPPLSSRQSEYGSHDRRIDHVLYNQSALSPPS